MLTGLLPAHSYSSRWVPQQKAIWPLSHSKYECTYELDARPCDRQLPLSMETLLIMEDCFDMVTQVKNVHLSRFTLLESTFISTPFPRCQMLPKSDSEKSVHPITHSPQFSGLPWKLLFGMTSPTRPAHYPAPHWRRGSSHGQPGHWSSTAWGLHSQNRGDPGTSLPAASSCPKARTKK